MRCEVRLTFQIFVESNTMGMVERVVQTVMVTMDMTMQTVMARYPFIELRKHFEMN